MRATPIVRKEDKGYYKTCEEMTTVIEKINKEIDERRKQGKSVERLLLRQHALKYELFYIRYNGPEYFF